MNLWGFLSFGLVIAAIFVMFIVYLHHQKAMMKLELEASKLVSERELRAVGE